MSELINVTTRVDKNTHEWLKDKANKEMRSIASIIAIAIKNHKENNQEKKYVS